jgi:hypothetical protein
MRIAPSALRNIKVKSEEPHRSSRRCGFSLTPERVAKGRQQMKWQDLLNPPKGIGRLSLLVGYVAGEACSLFAIFVAHTMNPISYRIVEDNPQLRAIYGRYQELYSLDGLALTLAASFVVCAMACCAVRGIAWAIAESKAGFDQQAMGHLAWVSGKNR